jgi:carboxypeptidase D
MIPRRLLACLAVLFFLALGPADAFGQSYRTYTQIAQLMQDAETAYPSLCRRVNLGNSVQSRPIWALNISDNVGVEEDEPEFKYISTMHGDEWTGNEMMLYLIDELLGQYGIDPQVTSLVNELDIWIVPVMNPDGFQFPQRGNINGVDLNRDFPDRIDDAINTTAGRQAETAVIMNWSFANSFTASANIHTGALVANYPYDGNSSGSSVYTPCPDDDLFIYLCEQYSQHNLPMWNSSSFFHGITNGADWYVIYGGMQDWNYVWMGCNEITLELSNTKIPSASQIPTYWSQNRDSLLAYMDTALIGVRGLVTDALTGDPLAATVTVAGRDHEIYTDPDVGDYHRMLLPGTYDLMFEVPDYGTKTINNVAVNSGVATRLDVTMAPPPAIDTASLPAGNAFVDYGPVALTVSGGSPPLIWDLVSIENYLETDLGACGFSPVGVAQGWFGDDIFQNYALPFDFPYYGATYDTVRVWSNGFLNFGAHSGSAPNNSDAGLIANKRIAPLWDDLRTNYPGKDIYIDESEPDRVTIRWDAVTYAGLHQVDVSVTLFDDGTIQFHYGPSNAPISPTVGLSNGDEVGYTLASHNNATSLTSANSLEFTATSALPEGLTLSSDGVLSGTPTTWGAYNITVKVTDNDGRSDQQSYNLTIAPPNANGDFNADGRVDLRDYAAYQQCHGEAPAGNCGAAFEFVPNGMIDLTDFAVLTSQMTGPAD